MDAAIRAGINKLAIALAHLWFFHSNNDWFLAFVYGKDLDTDSHRLKGKRIKVKIEIEDNPSLKVRTNDTQKPTRIIDTS